MPAAEAGGNEAPRRRLARSSRPCYGPAVTDVLPAVEVGPQGADATAAVVWLHGLGADGHDFEPIVPMLQCPHVRFVFPHAPPLPVTINGGVMMPAWYDILSLDERDGRENADHIRASAVRVVQLLERERERGVPTDRIVLAGFSQGAAMTLHVAPRLTYGIAGIMALSGYHALSDQFEAERTDANVKTPMFFGHGSMDPVVMPAWGRTAFDEFSGWSQGKVEWSDYPMGHEVCPDEIADVRQWLHTCLPQ